MIATIIYAALLLTMIGCAVIHYKKYAFLPEIFYIMLHFILILTFVMALLLSNGYKSDVENSLMKETIVYNFERCPCEKHLRDVENYNSQIENFNNLWCRFKIEDRSEYYIDINELLKGDEK